MMLAPSKLHVAAGGWRARGSSEDGSVEVCKLLMGRRRPPPAGPAHAGRVSMSPGHGYHFSSAGVSARCCSPPA